eukprot:12355525-Alexandrium_andersonii.AAC.1
MRSSSAWHQRFSGGSLLGVEVRSPVHFVQRRGQAGHHVIYFLVALDAGDAEALLKLSGKVGIVFQLSLIHI